MPPRKKNKNNLVQNSEFFQVIIKWQKLEQKKAAKRLRRRERLRNKNKAECVRNNLETNGKTPDTDQCNAEQNQFSNNSCISSYKLLDKIEEENEITNRDVEIVQTIDNLSNRVESNVSENYFKVHDFPKSWTRNMIEFYTTPDETLKNFDYVQIQKTMEGDPSNWWINDADKSRSYRRKNHVRCGLCNRIGHIKKECKKLVVCYLCGEFNHLYSNCPNALCFTCGRSSPKYLKNCRCCRKILRKRKKCELCGQIWHEKELCPSQWRKYSILPFSKNGIARPNSRRYCYNCAQKGHFGFQCPQILDSDYPPEDPFKTAYPDPKNQSKDQLQKMISTQYNEYGIRYRVVYLCQKTVDLLLSEEGNNFLKSLSDETCIRIELFYGEKRQYIKFLANKERAGFCKNRILKWTEEQEQSVIL